MFFFLISSHLFAQEVVINEVMSSNSRTIMDEDEDYPDWIELYNAGSDAVNLNGYGLSDDYDRPFRWIIPDVTIEPGDFLLIWASGKDRNDTSAPLHTNYSIGSAGEEVILTNPEGERVDEFEPIAIPTDVSYGRKPDGSQTWAFFNTPTPGSSNEEEEALETTPGTPVFSHAGGFYTNEFELTLETDDPDAEIIYTLDGSEPDPDNLDGQTYTYKHQYRQGAWSDDGDLLEESYESLIYNEPILIINRENEEDQLTQLNSTYQEDPWFIPSTPVFKGTTVRAKLVKEGHLPGKTISNTYFVTPEGINRYSFPVVSISVQEDHLFDYNDGIYVAGVDFDEWRDENQFQWADGGVPANYQRRGIEAEKNAHIQYFTQEEGLALDQDFGLRIHGGWSRSEPLKSLRLYARNSYGPPYFEYPLFPDQEFDQYKRFMLRNSGNDLWTTLFRDAAIQAMVKPLKVDQQAFQPTVTFLNGEYWGILNARERYDKHYLARTYDVDPEEVDLIIGYDDVSAGSVSHYHETIEYIEQNPLSEEEHYEYVTERIDVDDFMDYQILQIFINNTDWPGNNVRYWRHQTNEYNPDAPHGHDGRWRWLLFDTDFGFSLYDGQDGIENNTLEFATAPDGPDWPNPPWATFLLRSLLENDNFERSFVNRYNSLLNSTFSPERVIRIIDEFEELYEPEITEHMHRWGAFSEDINEWRNNINVMRDFANQRPEHARNHLRDYFDLGGDVAVTFDVSDTEQGHIRVNTLDIDEENKNLIDDAYPYEGLYFQGMPVQLEAIAQPGYRFVEWSGTGNDSTSVDFIPESDTTITAVFEPDTGAHLLHYWNFNEYETPYEPSYTYTQANIDITEGDNTSIQFVTGGGFEGENARKGDDAGRHLYIDQAEGTTIELTFPTTGYENIVMSYEITGTGPKSISYIDDDDNTLFRQVELSGQPPFTYVVDFSEIEEANHQSEFTIRMTFGQAGNFRLDNLTIEGTKIEGANLPPVINDSLPHLSLIEGGVADTISLENVFLDPDLDQLVYTVTDSGQVNAEIYNEDQLIISPLQRGMGSISISADDGQNELVQYDLPILVYPKARKLTDADFSFLEWSEDEPEHSYPEHILFLQSDTDDPGVDYPLLYPYHLAPEHYHSDDAHAIGYPYQATRRTRLNGLGEEGISMINTGRGRDLGGVLLAVNTQDISTLRADWVCETILQNSRMYGIALHYRIGSSGEFHPVSNDAEDIYQARYDGHEEAFEIALPEEVYDEEYVQLLWRYYHISGTSGPRAQLRIDDINIGSVPGTTKITEVIYENTGITIEWLPAYGAEQYEMEIATDETFNDLIQEHRSLEEQELFLTGLPDDTLVHVRVRGVVNDDKGPWYTDSLHTEEPIVTSAKSLHGESHVSVYPNPTKGVITLDINHSSASEAVITIFDQLGRVVYKEQGFNVDEQKSNKKFIDLSKLPTGTYVLSIALDQEQLKEKIILYE